jgi:ABC-2 type transport system ATP-binding protein
MKDDLIIEASNISMRFNMNKENIFSLKEYFIKFLKGRLVFEEFWALKDVSVNVKRGEVLGIVGLNGAGKSTLLKVIAGVLKPTKGKIDIKGSIAPLIELGAGFDMELTARENIYLNGAILGHSRKFMKTKFDEIVEFSELIEFLDVPLKNYSSGMVARIGFAIATVIQPDILIVDEILSVGDFKFQEKCEKRIKALFDMGTTVIIVSHSISQIEALCSKVLWLEHGLVKKYGDTKEICDEYKSR